jgi:signal transduction histidine kinase/ActR/RegA family two-component response regulator
MMSTRSVLVRYLASVASVGIVVVTHLELEALFGDVGTFGLFYVAVLLSAHFAGFGPGLLTTGASSLAALLLMRPQWTQPAISSAASITRHAVFIGTGVMICWLTEGRRLSRDRAEATRVALERHLESARVERESAEVERQKLLDGERAARAQAEHMIRTKDEFLATLSHELRTPLNAVLGWSQLLRAGKMGPNDLARGLEVIERNARAQAKLVEDLLDMSRIISGKARLDVRSVDLAVVIDAAIEAVRPAAQAKSIRISKSVDLASSQTSGDPARLQQIIWNLLSNAIKFTPSGGSVDVTLRRVDDDVEIAVTDTGQGISPEFMPHVFERFRQADPSVTRVHSGLGLGLAIARHLVELHGGTVRATSEGSGRGAVFSIRLPGTPEQSRERAIEPPPPPSERSSEPGTYTPPPLNGVKVLVVDDDLDARELGARILLEHNADVLTAGSAAEALDMLKRERPNVLVSDIGMPGEDGYALIGKTRALGEDAGGTIPAIALTAFARADDRRRALLAGFQVHLPKPVDPIELVAAVAALAGRTGKVTRARKR